MNREQARQEVITRFNNELEPDESKKGYVCPICGSGTGPNGTGITTKNGGQHYTCWAGCFQQSSPVDIMAIRDGLPNASDGDKLKHAYDCYRIDIDGPADQAAKQPQSAPAEPIKEEPKKPKADYTEFYRKCAYNVIQSDYLQRRGISAAVQSRFNIGFCPNWRAPGVPDKVPFSPRVIIPTSDSTYLARDTRDVVPDQAKQYVKQKIGGVHSFNREALDNPEKCAYIVEGEIDALSIIEAGGSAVALGSTSQAKKFLEHVNRHAPARPVIIAMDNDEAGRKCEAELIDGLEKAGVPFFIFNPAGEYKDANERLVKDRPGFIEAVKYGIELEQAEREKIIAEYVKENTAAGRLQDFADGISMAADTQFIPTGFNALDCVFDGGLYEGLYIIGAISSLGKTTFVMQIADQIASAGHDVMIFSLEMATTELMSKSISRITLIKSRERRQSLKDAKTARGITTRKRYDFYSDAEKNLIGDSIQEYGSFADKLYISEGIGNIGASQVREAVKKHISITGRKPVIVIDYFQILAPADTRATDKQNTDKAVLELKRLSRDYKIPVIGISSFNRENYSSVVNMSAFKESGAIEYSSDVLIGLQLNGAGDKGFNVDEAKAKNPREVELKILKNRNGATGNTIKYEYYPMFNYFEETGRD